MTRRKIPYLRDKNLVSFRIPAILAESIRLSQINIKAVCIQALWKVVSQNTYDEDGASQKQA